MDAPYTIASLPKPLDSEHGKLNASAVHSVVGSKKRKRHEVAVGVDGEEVKVYNIQSQEAVTSYAIPPQAYLCCPPCSVYVRRPKPARAHRRTYLVLRNGPRDTKRRLICFTEERQKDTGVSDVPSGPKKQERRLQGDEVHSVDVVPTLSSQDDETPHVLVSYKDGRVECLSADLSKIIWEHEAGAQGNGTVEYAGLTDADTARKGLLAGREDVLAALDFAPGSAPPNAQLLFRILHFSGKRSLQIFSLRPVAIDAIQSQTPGMQHLVGYELPHPPQKNLSGRATFDVHASSGKVYQLLNGKLSVYDVSGMLPRHLTNFGTASDRVSSFARISSSAVLAIQGGKAVVYETRYGAVFASVAMTSEVLSNAGQKRKHQANEAEEAVSKAPCSTVSYFQDSGLVAGLSGTDLIALQLSEDIRRAKRGRAEDTMLVDVLGKGSLADVSLPMSNTTSNAKKSEQWEAWKARVDDAVATEESQDLESLLLSSLRKSKPAHERKDRTLTNGATMEDEVDVELDAGTFDSSAVDRPRVLYILSKVFRAHSDADSEHKPSSRLQAVVSSAKVYEWLAIAGFLTLSHVRQATARYDTVLHSGDLARAIADFDGTFELMHTVLGVRSHWELPELVQALRCLLLSLSTRPTSAATKALPAPPQTNGDVAMVNGEADAHLESESALAEMEVDMALEKLLNDTELRSETLRIVLDRLTAYPRSSITATMRSMMKHEELFYFMKLMRVELLEGGWHQRYVYTTADQDDDGARDKDFGTSEDVELRNHAIGEIGLLTSCAIDAVGLSGWLVGQSADVEGTYEFMRELRNEVGASLEGLFEYDAMTLFLGEVEKLQYSAVKAERKATAKRNETAKRNDKAKGKKAVKGKKKAKREETHKVEKMPARREVQKMLPMGGEAGGATGRSGKREKSKSLVAQEARARVGKYVFERIRI